MTDIQKSYDPKECEARWYAFWDEKGYFKPEVNPEGKPYCIVIPPPNVTGSLHMGHALNATIQDMLVRWRRMLGDSALWLPGTDHAGIATQNVVERGLHKEGTDRHTLGREAFTERVWEWKAEYGGRIIHQLRSIGASADWSRERFTLDEGLSRAVRKVFVSLYNEGLMYRATRLINWCPRCHTALSDIEVEHDDVDGALTYIKYPLSEGGGHLTVATTRPETMLGDTAVAVNPDDERYSGLIGKKVDLPLTGRSIHIVGDSEVDPSFGTGAVKVTPAHDFNDEAIALRQSPRLEFISVIGDDARMTEDAGQAYEGLDRYECRTRVVDALREQGLIEKEEKHRHAVGHCYRCKTVIEPILKPQWYVKVGPLAEEAIKAVREKRIRIIPEGWENSYFAWMENIKDWCVSRQIWWGHRIPVWYCEECGAEVVAEEEPTKCTSCGSGRLVQESDVLDTWFSSALWPFSTLGWPEKTHDLESFYPTSVLVTAFDILFFWVARMIMMGLKFMGDIPFKDVYIHALIRDSEGQKMSKSKGNVIDPLVMIDRHGADAFRFTLAAFAAQGRDVRFSEDRVKGYRHFINKLWNATKFIMMNVQEGNIPDPQRPKDEELDLASRWILSRLSATAADVNKSLEEYRFNDAASRIYQFVWHEFCDWYIEMSKIGLSDPGTGMGVRWCLLHCLETILRMLHPIMPFVTEELWQTLKPFGFASGESIMTAPFPVGLESFSDAEGDMLFVMEAVTGVRNIRGELDIKPGAKLDVFIRTTNPDALAVIENNREFIITLARAGNLTAGTDVEKPEGAAISVREGLEVYVPIKGLLDVDAEIGRLNKELAKVEESIEFIDKKLSNEGFVGRAPADVVEKEKKRHSELVEKRDKLREGIERMEALRG